MGHLKKVDFKIFASYEPFTIDNIKITPIAVNHIEDTDGFLSKIDRVDYVFFLTENRKFSSELALTLVDFSAEKRARFLFGSGLRVKSIEEKNTQEASLKKGLDLEGGTRVLLKSSEKVDKETIELTASSLRERLNVYGLSDIVVKPAADLAGNNFILVEIAGATEEEVKELLAKQGKFEAKIGNDTVFFGGKKDITYVCRTADCSGIDSRRGCSKVSDGYACGFIFGITLSPEAAQRQADLTKSLTVSTENGQSYLSQDITLYLDDQEVDRLRIGAELKGRASTDIQISGGGNGRTENEAISNTLQNMDRLRTIIITGSLPIKLEVAKMDTISPTLGKEFLNNIFFVGFLAMVAVGAVVAIRYRKLKIIVPMILTLCSEVMLILGFAALAGTNLDLAAIAGIIIVIGTGVDHLIIITDEALRGGSMAEAIDWKKKIKNVTKPLQGHLKGAINEKEKTALITLFLLFLTRETTILLGVILVAVSWFRGKKLFALGALVVVIISFLVSGSISGIGQPNSHDLNPLVFMMFKFPYHFLANGMGVRLWVTGYDFCEPVLKLQLPPLGVLGSIREVGFCGFDAALPLRNYIALFSTFGVMPLAFVYAFAKKGWRTMKELPFWFPVAVIYGLAMYAVSIPAGTGVSRIVGYAWPVFLLATPFLVAPFVRENRRFLAKFAGTQVFAAWMPFIVQEAGGFASVPVMFFTLAALGAAYVYTFLLLKKTFSSHFPVIG